MLVCHSHTEKKIQVEQYNYIPILVTWPLFDASANSLDCFLHCRQPAGQRGSACQPLDSSLPALPSQHSSSDSWPATSPHLDDERLSQHIDNIKLTLFRQHAEDEEENDNSTSADNPAMAGAGDQDRT